MNKLMVPRIVTLLGLLAVLPSFGSRSLVEQCPNLEGVYLCDGKSSTYQLSIVETRENNQVKYQITSSTGEGLLVPDQILVVPSEIKNPEERVSVRCSGQSVSKSVQRPQNFQTNSGEIISGSIRDVTDLSISLNAELMIRTRHLHKYKNGGFSSGEEYLCRPYTGETLVAPNIFNIF